MGKIIYAGIISLALIGCNKSRVAKDGRDSKKCVSFEVSYVGQCIPYQGTTLCNAWLANGWFVTMINPRMGRQLVCTSHN